MKKFFKEFSAFISKGNVIDLAVAVIIGNSFSAIVNSLVNDIIMPPIKLATKNGVAGLSIVLNNVPKYLSDGSINPQAILWNYGNFLQTIINFFVIALCIFVAIKITNKLKNIVKKPKPETPQAETTNDILISIRNELKNIATLNK